MDRRSGWAAVGVLVLLYLLLATGFNPLRVAADLWTAAKERRLETQRFRELSERTAAEWCEEQRRREDAITQWRAQFDDYESQRRQHGLTAPAAVDTGC